MNFCMQNRMTSIVKVHGHCTIAYGFATYTTYLTALVAKTTLPVSSMKNRVHIGSDKLISKLGSFSVTKEFIPNTPTDSLKGR